MSVNDTMKKKYGWQPKGLLGAKELKKQQNKKKTEILMADQITNVRTSPLPLEFLVPKNGKKFMDRNGTVRALQSKISLKFPLASAEDAKPK